MLTITDVCQRLRCSHTTAYRLVNTGLLKAHKLPGRNSTLRISEEAFEDFLRDNVAYKADPAPTETAA